MTALLPPRARLELARRQMRLVGLSPQRQLAILVAALVQKALLDAVPLLVLLTVLAHEFNIV